MEEVSNTSFSPSPEQSEIVQKLNKIRELLGQYIIGQHDMIDLILAAILADGHVLLEGVPGVAKTLTSKLIAKSIDAKFSRIQFRTSILSRGSQHGRFKNQQNYGAQTDRWFRFFGSIQG